VDPCQTADVTIFDEDGVATPTWQINKSVNAPELVVPLYVRDRLGLQTSSTVPALTPSVRAIPSEALNVAAASTAWESVWAVIAQGGPGSSLPYAPVRFHGLTEYSELIGPWAWLYEEAEAWEGAKTKIRDRVERARANPMFEQTLIEDLAVELGRPVKPFLLELEILPVEGTWWQQAYNGRVFLSSQLEADRDAYTSLLLDLLKPIA